MSAAKSLVSWRVKQEPLISINEDFLDAAHSFSFRDFQHGLLSVVAFSRRLLLKKLQYRKVSSGSGSAVEAVKERIWENWISHVRLRESRKILEFAAWFSGAD